MDNPLSDKWDRVEPTNSRLKKYNLSREKYWEWFDQQGGVCAICKERGGKVKGGHYTPIIDHCHDTMEARGLLCNRCNPPLGYAHDSPKRLIQMVEYMLSRNKHECSKRGLLLVQKFYDLFDEVGFEKITK
jgi:hypothetical protein